MIGTDRFCSKDITTSDVDLTLSACSLAGPWDSHHEFLSNSMATMVKFQENSAGRRRLPS